MSKVCESDSDLMVCSRGHVYHKSNGDNCPYCNPPLHYLHVV